MIGQPFAIAQQRSQPTGSVVRQYRAPEDPDIQQPVKDAFRQCFDLIYTGRQQYGPAALFAVGAGDPITVTPDPLGAGLTLNLTRPGTWIIQCSVALAIVADAGQIFTVSLVCGGVRLGAAATVQSAGDAIFSVSQHWQFVSINGNEVCRLLIQKDAGGGTSNVVQPNSTLVAMWQGA